MRTVVIVSFFSVGCLIAAPAFAQSELEGMSFEDLIGQAKTAYEAENYPDAIKYLLAANRAQPNARLLLNVAKSYEKSNQCVKAMVYFRAFVRDADAEPALADQARESLAARDKCTGWNDLMSGRLILSAVPKGASAKVDGQDIGTHPTEITGLMEGKHTLEVTLEGYQPHEETLNLFPDKDAVIRVELRDKPPEAVELVEQPVVVPPESKPPILGYAIGGGVAAVGIGLLVGGMVTDLGIPKKYDDDREQVGISRERFDQLTEDRKGAVTTAWILYIAGGVLTAGGAGYLAYVGATSGTEKKAAPMLGIAPALDGSGLGVTLSGKF